MDRETALTVLYSHAYRQGGLRAVVVDTAASEYISEAEQDGEEFWDNFRSAKELLDDFRTYLRAVLSDDAGGG